MRNDSSYAAGILDDSYEQYAKVEGLVWPSAKNGQTIYAVYQTAADDLILNQMSSLHTAPILTQVMDIAMRYRIIIEDL